MLSSHAAPVGAVAVAPLPIFGGVGSIPQAKDAPPAAVATTAIDDDIARLGADDVLVAYGARHSLSADDARRLLVGEPVRVGDALLTLYGPDDLSADALREVAPHLDAHQVDGGRPVESWSIVRASKSPVPPLGRRLWSRAQSLDTHALWPMLVVAEAQRRALAVSDVPARIQGSARLALRDLWASRDLYQLQAAAGGGGYRATLSSAAHFPHPEQMVLVVDALASPPRLALPANQGIPAWARVYVVAIASDAGQRVYRVTGNGRRLVEAHDDGDDAPRIDGPGTVCIDWYGPAEMALMMSAPLADALQVKVVVEATPPLVVAPTADEDAEHWPLRAAYQWLFAAPPGARPDAELAGLVRAVHTTDFVGADAQITAHVVAEFAAERATMRLVVPPAPPDGGDTPTTGDVRAGSSLQTSQTFPMAMCFYANGQWDAEHTPVLYGNGGNSTSTGRVLNRIAAAIGQPASGARLPDKARNRRYGHERRQAMRPERRPDTLLDPAAYAAPVHSGYGGIARHTWFGLYLSELRPDVDDMRTSMRAHLTVLDVDRHLYRAGVRLFRVLVHTRWGCGGRSHGTAPLELLFHLVYRDNGATVLAYVGQDRAATQPAKERRVGWHWA